MVIRGEYISRIIPSCLDRDLSILLFFIDDGGDDEGPVDNPATTNQARGHLREVLSMLAFQDIHYSYPKSGGRQFGVSDLSFDVSPGEIFTLLGPNGAGKTTIIRILSGLIVPKSGDVTVCGHSMSRDEYKARRTIGLVLGDERTFYYRISGRQNLEFFGGLYGIKRSVLRPRIDKVLDMVGLTADAGLKFMRYSSGMKKRLSLARAMLHDPAVYMLDEPNSGVDPESANKIRRIISDFKRAGKTIFLTTHDMAEAERMSDRIGFLREGRLVKIGRLDEYKRLISRKILEIAFDNPDDISAATCEAIQNRLHGMTAGQVAFDGNRLTFEFNGDADLNTVLAVVLDSGFHITGTTTMEPTLEEVFLTLVNDHV